MSRFSPQDLDDIKARNSLADVAGGYVQLRRAGGHLVGPCPICGGKVASQRFEILADCESWVCAVCPDGGDVIRLVEKVEGCDFLAAVERLGGRVAADPEAAKLLFEEREKKRLAREKTAAGYREAERKRLWRMWESAIDNIHGTPVEHYLAGRALQLPLASPGLRYLPSAPYWHGETVDQRGRRSPRKIHAGPAMLAAFIRPDKKFGGLHITWLTTDEAPTKLEIADPECGELLDAKKMRGSKTGAHIAIVKLPAPRRLVIGEGIETVLAVWTAHQATGRSIEDMAFWAAGDLGNLAGRALETIAHPELKRPDGRAQRVPGPYPDPDDAGLAIPESVEELILLGDGDSEPVLTRCAMERAARRYAKAGREIRIAFVPAGLDFNDVLLRNGAGEVLAVFDAALGLVDVAQDPAAEAEAVRKFGLAELDATLADLRAAEGQARGMALSASAQWLGQLAGAGALHEGFARAALEDAAGVCGLIRDDGLRAVKAAIAAGLKIGKKQPRNLSDMRGGARRQRRPRPISLEDSSPPLSSPFPAPPAVGGEPESSRTGANASNAPEQGRGGGRKPPDATESADARNMRLAFFPLTDLGNAERFRERYQNKLLWCEPIGWLAWDGKRWSRDGAGSLLKIAEHVTVRAIQDEARAVRDSGVKGKDPGGRDYVVDEKKGILYSDRIANWGRSSEALNKLGALSKRGEPYFSICIEKLDADKLKINFNNGTVSIARKSDGDDYVSFASHDPVDLITKLSLIDFDPAADCPEYDKFLQRVQPGPEMRTFLHQWGGLSLTGDVSEEKMAFFYGKGGNGKSVLVEAWSVIAGDYGETVPIETFIDHGKARAAGAPSPDLAVLPGVRMLRTSEPEKNAKLAESLIKLVTGGEPLPARHLNRDMFKFYPQFKLTMAGNYKPSISGTDEGIWRRVQLVPFDVHIPTSERDVHLKEKLRKEASGILNRLLDGLRDWCDRGLIEPDAVAKATADYRSASDPLGRFLLTCVVGSIGDRVQSSVLHELYEAWCKSSGEKAWSNRGLSMALDERGYKRKQSNVVWWLDVKLIRHVDDFVDSAGHPVRISDEMTAKEAGEAGDVEF
jgi:putative DNA primase/helicase